MSSLKQIIQPQLSRLRERIAALKRIDLECADIDFLKERLVLLFTGYSRSVPILNIGQRIYRGVSWKQRPGNIRELSYPPPSIIQKLGRANRIADSKFYCSVARGAVFFEIGALADDFIAVSEWEITNKFFLNVVGDEEFVLKKLGSSRSHESFGWKTDNPFFNNPSNKLVSRFLANEFTKIVLPRNENQYKLSIAIAEKLFGNIEETDGKIDAPNAQPQSIGGIMYPAVGMWGNAENLVLNSTTVDRCLRLINVEYIRVDEQKDRQFQVTPIDFANTFSENGEIEWKGRRLNWQLNPGDTYKIVIEHGRFVARSVDGKLIDPN